MGRKRLKDFDLPNRVYLEHGAYFYRFGSKRVWLTRDRSELSEALRRCGVVPTEMVANHLKTVFAHARKNARSRGIEMALTWQDVQFIWARSAGRCELTNIKFDLIRGIGFRRRPFAPSIDRLSSRHGYTPANCRLIVVALNLAMNEWGTEVFGKVASSFLRHRKNIRNIPLGLNIPQR